MFQSYTYVNGELVYPEHESALRDAVSQENGNFEVVIDCSECQPDLYHSQGELDTHLITWIGWWWRLCFAVTQKPSEVLTLLTVQKLTLKLPIIAPKLCDPIYTLLKAMETSAHIPRHISIIMPLYYGYATFLHNNGPNEHVPLGLGKFPTLFQDGTLAYSNITIEFECQLGWRSVNSTNESEMSNWIAVFNKVQTTLGSYEIWDVNQAIVVVKDTWTREEIFRKSLKPKPWNI